MKKFTLSSTLLILFSLYTVSVFAQSNSGGTFQTSLQRCGTTQWYEEQFRVNPAFRAQFEANQANIAQLAAQGSANRTTALVDTIPVVVHIILANASTVTDATVQSQMDVLNEDFKGLNADSTLIPAAFKPLFGKAGIHWMLAKQDPNGDPTTAIQRRDNAVTYTGANYNNAKTFATGGLDAWDPCRYLNIWVIQFTDGTLGVSVFPGTPAPAIPGFVCEYRAFGRGPAYLYPEFNKGRTSTHEIGHFVNMRHINGDAACGDDFPGSAPGLDDTPQQNNLTGGCPSGVVSSGCAAAPTPPGRMYQNYMDYTDDACMVMFTKGQVSRMETALLFAPDRNCLLNSNAYQAPVLHPYDASITSINNPQNNQGFCGVTSITPQVTLKNSGTNTLTSATITVSLNGGTPTNYQWSGSLATAATATVNLNAINGLVAGSHTLNICVTNVNNGQTDGNASNNCRTVTFSIVGGASGGIAPPIFEGFESTTFNPTPTGWTVINPDNGITWARTTLAARTGTASARINLYSYSASPRGQYDYLRSPLVNYGNSYDSAMLSFAYAYKWYNSTTLTDTLEVVVSTDCGANWITVWRRGGSQLGTVVAGATANWTPTGPADWRHETVNLSAYRNMPVYVALRSINRYGQNMYVDDINLYGIINVNNDASVTSIVNPPAALCNNSTTPQVVVKNSGLLPLTSVKIRYRVDNLAINETSVTSLNIAPGGSQTFTLANITGLTAGNHTFTVYTAEPNGVADQNPSNDTLRSNFTVIIPANLPVVEGFEGTTFPPAGWSVINPDNGITWVKVTGVGKTGTGSAGINIYNYTTVGALDYLRSPLLNFSGFSGGSVSFHYAYKQYSATANDSLALVVSTDCGATWTTLWTRGGSSLTTSPGLSGLVSWFPTAAEWTQNPIEVDLTPYIGGNIYVAFRSRNAYGNNMFVDDVNIRGVYNYDVEMSAINSPFLEECSVPFTPEVRIRNRGVITLNSVKVNYSIDNGPAVSATFTGMALARDRDTTLRLPAITSLGLGVHTFRVYSFEPNGQVDQNRVNDTLNRTFTLLATTTAPLVEGFENPTFPPPNWRITQQPADAVTWQRTTLAARTGVASAYMDNYDYAFNDRVDNLFTPVVSYSGADSVFLRFDVAATTYSFPGSTAVPLDTLEVLVTRDCGRTFSSIYKKFGNELQTIGDPNSTNTTEFFPTSSRQWRSDSINLTRLLGAANTVRFVFKNTTNYENNIFIDNVNFSPKTLPERLKQNGLLITPNPFQSTFYIQHYLPPTDLRGFGVYNAIGQQVLSRSFGEGMADSYIPVNMSNLPAGMYTVKLMYTGRTVAQRIIKLN